jgi:OmpA-OmpF porin, OOP family
VSLVYRFGGSPAPRQAAEPMPVTTAAAPAPAPALAPEPAPPPAPAAPPPAAPVIVHFSADALFGFDSSTLRPGATSQLDALASDLRNVQYSDIRIVGHTDRLGRAAYNQRLSERRADAVAAYLVHAGLPAARVHSSGMGEREPLTQPTECVGKVASPALITCLQRDRRGDVQVDGSRGEPR